jgi:phage terminase small subunit
LAKNLTKKQEIFVAEYLVDFNATRAAIAAGYSENGAEVRGSELLRNRKVSEVIAQKTDQRLQKLGLSADRVLLEIARIATLDMRKLFNSDGSPKDILTLDDDTAAAIASFEAVELFDGSQGDQKHVTGLVKKVKAWDKLRALELYGKYKDHAWWKESVEHNVHVDNLTDDERAAKIAAILNAARARRDKNAK